LRRQELQLTEDVINSSCSAMMMSRDVSVLYTGTDVFGRDARGSAQVTRSRWQGQSISTCDWLLHSCTLVCYQNTWYDIVCC